MTRTADTSCELTILMPCLNEEETVGTCVAKARSFLDRTGISGEVLVADNGSTDQSVLRATTAGARVCMARQTGYGAALQEGIKCARGRFVIMGDADDSYDFTSLWPFVDELRHGAHLVMGNRFRGGIERSAMPALHRYLGNPVLSALGRMFYGCSIGDFHCGLRGFNRQAILDLDLRTTGMEYASEMVVQATLHDLRIVEVPTTLSKAGRTRPPHLRSWHDGWRHLKFLLMYAPNWLFVYPGAALLMLGALGMVVLTLHDVGWGPVGLGIHTLLYAAAAVIVGFTLLSFGYLTRIFAKRSGYIPDAGIPRILERFTLERGVLAGAALVVVGIALSLYAVGIWSGGDGFKELDPTVMMRITIPAVTFLIVGVELQFLSFFAGIMAIKRRSGE